MKKCLSNAPQQSDGLSLAVGKANGPARTSRDHVVAQRGWCAGRGDTYFNPAHPPVLM